MKRTHADLDALSSSPSPKRHKNATRATPYPAVQDTSSQSSSPPTLVASSPEPALRTSEPASESSTSSQSESGSSNTFSSESEFFQRPVGRDPNDSQESHYNSSVIESTDSELNNSDPEAYERNEGWKTLFVLSALDEGRRHWDAESTSAKSSFDSGKNPKSFSSTSASISDDVSQSSSSVSQASSSSGSSSSSEPAPASEHSNLSSSSASHPSSSSSASLSAPPSPTTTTTTHPQLSTTNLSQLQSRLQTLLPQLRSANQELEAEKAEGRLGERDIEKVEEEGKGYIEMELGLGVLEQRGEREEGEEDKQANEGGEGDVLGKLMGKKGKRKDRGRGKRKVGIEEVGG